MSEVPEQIMSPLRSSLFPIYRHEFRQFFLMSVMIFLTIFSFYLLRGVKDALLQSAPDSGAEVFSFLKLYLVLPATMLVMAGYVSLRKRCDLQRAYYIVLSLFGLFFAFYALYLYPNCTLLQPDTTYVASLKQMYPAFRWFFAIYQLWVLALFYVCSELWGALVLSVLFWQLANDNIPTTQAKRFYPLFITVGNVAMLCLNPLMHYIARDETNDIVQVSWLIVAIAAILCFCVHVAYKHQLLRVEGSSFDEGSSASRKSLFESIVFVMRSPYVMYISIMVLSYGVLINVVEAMWRSKVGVLYVTRSNLLKFNADYTFMTGLATIAMNYLSKRLISRVGWTTSALITPLVCACMGTIFFFFVTRSVSTFPLIALADSPLKSIVWLGAFVVLLSKGAKYSFFDPTKEMAFIPLDKELRSNGKVLADGVVERFGKSLGGATISSLIMLTGMDLSDLAYVLGVITLVLGIWWLYAVLRLGKLYARQVAAVPL